MKHSRAKWNAIIILNLASAACGFTGITLSLIVNGPSCLAMYTDEVSLFSGVVSMILAVKLLRVSKKFCKVNSLDSSSNISGKTIHA